AAGVVAPTHRSLGIARPMWHQTELPQGTDDSATTAHEQGSQRSWPRFGGVGRNLHAVAVAECARVDRPECGPHAAKVVAPTRRWRVRAAAAEPLSVRTERDAGAARDA